MQRRKRIFAAALALFLALMAGVMMIRQDPAGPAQVATPLQEKRDSLQAAVRKERTDRFRVPVVFTEERRAGKDGLWSQGVIKGMTVWRDNRTGLVWGPRLEIGFRSYRPDDLARAEAACAAQAPAGAWFLPSDREFDTARAHGLPETDPDARHRWISFSTRGTLREPVLRGWASNTVEKKFAARCVAQDRRAAQP